MGYIHRLASHTKLPLNQNEGFRRCIERIGFCQLPNHLPICRYCWTRLCWICWISTCWCLPPICCWIPPSCSQGRRCRSSRCCPSCRCPSRCCCFSSIHLQIGCCPSSPTN